MASPLQLLMHMKSFVSLCAFLLALRALAYQPGEKKLFHLEKSYNRENILIVHATVDDQCRYVPTNGEYIDFYWLMNRQTRKPVNPIIRGKVIDRFSFEGINNEEDRFRVTMNDLSELQHDLDSNTIEVIKKAEGDSCDVKAFIRLGPSADRKRMRLEKTYCDVSTNFVGLPNGCNYLDLIGTDSVTGAPLKARFKKK